MSDLSTNEKHVVAVVLMERQEDISYLRSAPEFERVKAKYRSFAFGSLRPIFSMVLPNIFFPLACLQAVLYLFGCWICSARNAGIHFIYNRWQLFLPFLTSIQTFALNCTLNKVTALLYFVGEGRRSSNRSCLSVSCD